jgi:hypothetical protein
VRGKIVRSLANILYRELVFQSTTLLRLGGFLKDMSDTNSSELLRKIDSAFMFNKIFSTILFAAIPWFYLLVFAAYTSSIAIRAVAMSSSIAVISLLAFLESLNNIGVYMIRLPEVLNLYPLSEKEKLFSIIVLYSKLYGVQVISFILSSTLVYAIVTRNPVLVSINVVISILCAVYGLTIASIMSKGFYSFLLKGGGRSRYFVSSVFSFLAVVIIMWPIVLGNILKTVLSLVTFMDNMAIRLIFPNPFFNILESLNLELNLFLIDYMGILAYVMLAYGALKFMYRELTSLINPRTGFKNTSVIPRFKPVAIKPKSITRAIINRYLRVVFRHPSYATGFFTPLALTVLNLLSGPHSFIEATVVATVAMIIYPVLMLSVEAHGHLLTISLPVNTSVITRSILIIGVDEYLIIYTLTMLYAGLTNGLTVSIVLETLFTIPLVISLMMLEIWLLFKMEGENLFTGTFYMKISKTIIIYIVLSVTVIAPVWGSYFFALLVLGGLYKTLIPLTLSLIILIVSTRLFLRVK